MEIPPVTRESIQRARDARDRERAEVEQQTGIRITGDGTIAYPVTRMTTKNSEQEHP